MENSEIQILGHMDDLLLYVSTAQYMDDTMYHVSSMTFLHSSTLEKHTHTTTPVMKYGSLHSNVYTW